MKLTLRGHEDRYAVEQLQMALFPAQTIDDAGEAISALHRGNTWLTAVTVITLQGKTSRVAKRLKAAEETVRSRRRLLQQSYYLAALAHLKEAPAWGALSGVRPTKITTKHILEGGTGYSAMKMMEQEYFVSPERARLSVQCSVSSAKAYLQTEEKDVSLYVGIPFCPTRCSYCSFVSRTVGKNTALLEPYLQALLQVRYPSLLRLPCLKPVVTGTTWYG